MRRDLVETLVGGAVLVLVALGIAFGFASSGLTTVDGYTVQAEFNDVSGVSLGTEVRLAGVKVGTVVDKELAVDDRLAVLTLEIDRIAVVPADTKVRILPEGLLGGAYVALEPGGSLDDLADGAYVTFDRTQGAINVLDLLSRFVVQAAEGAEEAGAEPLQ